MIAICLASEGLKLAQSTCIMPPIQELFATAWSITALLSGLIASPLKGSVTIIHRPHDVRLQRVLIVPVVSSLTSRFTR